jgi:hypothetical protein
MWRGGLRYLQIEGQLSPLHVGGVFMLGTCTNPFMKNTKINLTADGDPFVINLYDGSDTNRKFRPPIEHCGLLQAKSLNGRNIDFIKID